MEDFIGTLKPRSLTPNESSYAFNGKIMLCSAIVLFAALLIMVCFHGHARWIFNRQNLRRRRRRMSLHRIFSFSTTVEVLPRGLDRPVLKSLPIIIYNSKTHDPLLKCSVCLSEFKEDEKVRMLPKCKHTFHIRCIDMWFQSHSSCPLCRGPVQSVKSPQVSTETVACVTAPACSGPKSSHTEDDKMGCSSCSFPGSLTTHECQREPSELAGILVEVPSSSGSQRLRGLVDMGSGLPGLHGSKSAVRVVALKRIWSI